ncbi:hypothetical protein ACFSSA_11195 [Luteolibacter algae]|uniref:Discoidin domain-containing protein n=1 Tax=Luteolibacter algae TaxID=454151 RepID=A0ABW5D875_9BACT
MERILLILLWALSALAFLRAEPVWWQALPGDGGFGYDAICETPFGWASVGGHRETPTDTVVRVSTDGENWRQVHRTSGQSYRDIAWGA